MATRGRGICCTVLETGLSPEHNVSKYAIEQFKVEWPLLFVASVVDYLALFASMYLYKISCEFWQLSQS